MEPDFSGWATKASIKCKDGRTIAPTAFAHQDRVQVPLVWQHGHTNPENVLGHALLEYKDGKGVYAYGFLNDSDRAKHAAKALEHGDINMMSIWANELTERAGLVLHGSIKEVSLVLAGANPGAVIENVHIRHADDTETVLEEEAIIHTDLPFEQVAVSHAVAPAPAPEKEKAPTMAKDSGTDDGGDGETIQDVVDSMTEKQKNALYFLVGEAVSSAGDSVAQDDMGDSTYNEEDNTVRHSVFDPANYGGSDEPEAHTLSHDDMQGILKEAKRSGSFKEAIEGYALSHGITDIDTLFPDAKAIDTTPEFLSRRTEWVNTFLSGATKKPFAKIKTLSADITEDAARAKGYITGTLKREEFFTVSKRETGPTTIYKKQKLERDDLLDITDFDIVTWLKAEMRLMLDEEVARAALIGDGRDINDQDKISEQSIRPIANDHELFVTTVRANIRDANSSHAEIIDVVVKNRSKLKGTGLPVMFTKESVIAQFLLLKDTTGRDLYEDLTKLAAKLRVSAIVPVEVMEEDDDLLAIFVNPVDYTFGANAGGQVTMFDDFDIDWNAQKYLIETRVSGALTKLKSAMVVRRTAANAVLVVPAAPTFDGEEVTITDTTGVTYKHDGVTITNAGGPYAVTEGETYVVDAIPASSGYYFESSDDDSWSFTNEG